MGEAVLVDKDIDEGAILVREIDDIRHPVKLAFWGYLAALDEWRLFIAMSLKPTHSQSAGYRVIQRTLMHMELELPLSRISLVSAEDPTVLNIRSVISSDRGLRPLVPLGSTELAGLSIDKAYAYRTGPLYYERTLMSALKRIWTEGRVYEPRSLMRRSKGPQTDLMLAGQDRLVLVEAKATLMPVGREIVAQCIESRLQASELFRKPVAVLCVSKSGFKDAAYADAEPFPYLALVHWRDKRDDQALFEALRTLE